MGRDGMWSADDVGCAEPLTADSLARMFAAERAKPIEYRPACYDCIIIDRDGDVRHGMTTAMDPDNPPAGYRFDGFTTPRDGASLPVFRAIPQPSRPGARTSVIRGEIVTTYDPPLPLDCGGKDLR